MSEKPEIRIAVLVGLTLAFMIAIGNLYWHMEHMRTEMASLRHTLVENVAKLTEAASNVNRRAPVVVEHSRKGLDSLKQELSEELSTTKHQAAVATQHAKDALSRADKLAEQIGAEQQNQHKEVVGELGQIKEAEATATAKIEGVTADIANIKNDVASTRYELQQTVSELKRVTGDLGVQSGYIATNAKELSTLRLLGERNYFDFKIGRTGKAERVGEVAIILKKTDIKHNKYSLEVLAGDKRTEKKEKTINEPVQFYLSRVRLPFEIVVNEVQKDYIVGYLAAPKQLVTHTD